MILRYLFAVLILLFIVGNLRAEESLDPAMLSLPCTTCHGSSGKSHSTIPAIDNLTKQQFYQAMLAFKTGERHATLMNRIAKAYSDAELQAIAEYFGK